MVSGHSGLPDGLIETLLWTRGEGYYLREMHETRLKRSAAALGFAFTQASWDDALAQACAATQAASLRVRLVLRRGGAFEIAAAPFTPDPAEKVWRVGLAAARFDSGDPLLRHKTTRRDLYERALAASGADEVLFLNERGEVCEGARTNVFVERDCALLTPPVSSGLLPGVLRGALVQQGEAHEKVLRLEDLRDGFFLGNSLRGLLRGRLI